MRHNDQKADKGESERADADYTLEIRLVYAYFNGKRQVSRIWRGSGIGWPDDQP